jgi:hypothetical protein
VSETKQTPKPGDWVRFYQGGKIVLGVVQYVSPARAWDSSKWKVSTDVGQIGDDEILELRQGAVEPPKEG